MNVIVALLFDYKFKELPDSEESRTKRQITLSKYIATLYPILLE